MKLNENVIRSIKTLVTSDWLRTEINYRLSNNYITDEEIKEDYDNQYDFVIDILEKINEEMYEIDYRLGQDVKEAKRIKKATKDYYINPIDLKTMTLRYNVDFSKDVLNGVKEIKKLIKEIKNEK